MCPWIVRGGFLFCSIQNLCSISQTIPPRRLRIKRLHCSVGCLISVTGSPHFIQCVTVSYNLTWMKIWLTFFFVLRFSDWQLQVVGHCTKFTLSLFFLSLLLITFISALQKIITKRSDRPTYNCLLGSSFTHLIWQWLNTHSWVE